MSYYVQYGLTWEPKSPIVKLWLEAKDVPIDEDGESAGDNSWPHHEHDMLELSKLVPDVLLCLSGVGTEPGDMWRKYFLDGKLEECLAEIKYPPCTLRKTRLPN